MLPKVELGDQSCCGMRIQSSHISTDSCNDMAAVYYNLVGKTITDVNDTVTMSTNMLFRLITDAFRAGWECEMESTHAILHTKESNRAPTSIHTSIADRVASHIRPENLASTFYNKQSFEQAKEFSAAFSEAFASHDGGLYGEDD